MNNWLLLLLILVPLLGGLLEFALALGRSEKDANGNEYPGAGVAVVVTSLISLVLAAMVTARVAAGEAPVLEEAHLRADGMGAIMSLLVSVLGLIGMAYARRHLRAEVAAGRAKASWLPGLFGFSGLFMAAGLWAALTDHLIVLYIAVEATTLATVLPVAFYRTRTAWEATYKYLLLNTLGLTAGLLGLGLLYAAASPVLGEEALSLTALAGLGAKLDPGVAALAGALLICGFGTKAGLIPMHAWLPDAYQESPGGFIALFSGTGTKIALLALARVLPPLIASAPVLQIVLLAVAAITMLFGIAPAFRQDDLRRLLGYSSVSQMGYIAMAVAVGGTAGYTAASYHMVSHGLIKALLFLCVSEVFQATGTAKISLLRGKKLPRYAGPIFLLASLGLGGVPPMPAFWSKFQVFMAASNAGFTWAAAVAVLTSLLTITALVWAGARTFLLVAHDDHGHEGQAHGEAAPFPWLLGLLVAVIFAAGLAPGWMTHFLTTAAQALIAMGG